MATQITTITTGEIRRRKAALESKLTELVGLGGRREELQIDYLADPLDRVRSSTDREMAVQRFDQQTRLIHDIQSALDKIEDHTYGLYERCEEPMPRRRLDVVPWARFCVPCQAAEEAARQGATFEHAA